jgi:cytochrome c-type biogenesis protein CcmF
MENVGALAILLAFCLALYSIAASVTGKLAGKPFLAASGERAVYAVWLLLTIASGLLVYALITGDFRLVYVVEHSNKGMPSIYKFTAWWGGQEGSLLLWSWLLSTYSVVAVFTNRRKLRNMMPYVTAILMATEAFFLMLITFVLSPFQVVMAGKAITDMGDGQGLNPLLQYWTMIIHPPMLYLGYVGFAVPFAFAIGSLITRQPGDAWIHTTRRWAIVTWLFQTTGILLGAGWAYAVLGWGGYWAWDPVENASFLPWLTATAFLHSVMMQEKKGMMKVWNMVLVSTTFFLCILGTMLTRSGLVNSVHAFAQSSIGNYFTGFLAVGIAGVALLILSRQDYLKTEARLEGVISRESSFMFNNLVLLASCFAVLWGTLFPVISEAVTGDKISVDAPFYNRVMIPIALFLIFLTGVGPLIAWRRSSLESLKRAFLWPSAAGLALMTGLAIAGIWRQPYALISFGLCMFVTATIAIEFWKGANAIHIKDGLGLGRSMVELTHRNTRRYGGYLVHMGIVVMFVGFTGAAFNKSKTVEVAPGSSFDIGRYQLTALDTSDGENDNIIWRKIRIAVKRDGEDLGVMSPERQLFKASNQPNSMVAIRRRLNEDLYLNYAGLSKDNQRAVIQAYTFPLVSCIWAGFWVLLFGTVICLVPAKVRLQYPKTSVVGIARHATLEK